MVDDSQEIEHDVIPSPVEVPSDSEQFSKPKNKKKASSQKIEDKQYQEAYAIMKSLHEKNTNDEFSVFANNVAMKLRNIKNRCAVSVVQHIINTALFEAEIGFYDNFDNPRGIARSILPASTQPHSTVQSFQPSPSPGTSESTSSLPLSYDRYSDDYRVTQLQPTLPPESTQESSNFLLNPPAQPQIDSCTLYNLQQ